MVLTSSLCLGHFQSRRISKRYRYFSVYFPEFGCNCKRLALFSIFFQYTRVMVLLRVLLLSYAVLSDLFRVLVGDVSCAWPAPDFLCFLHYRVFWDRFFLATLAHLQEAFSFISFAVVFYFLGIIKVGYGVAPRSYPVFSMTCCLWSFLFFS